MPVGPARMPLLDHLGELRRRLTIVIVTIIVATVVFYFAAPTVIDVLTDPIAPFVGGEFYVMSALGGFSLRFSIALKTACVVCVPMILWQILGFFLPALKPNERKWVVPTLFIATALFFVGAVFCYFFIVPPGFEWLINETNSIATAFADLENYLNIEVLLMIGFGVAFELPLFVFYLAVFHIVPYVTFRAAWRYIYVAMAVIAATVTPDANPVTMIFMYAVLLSLYELSLFVTRFVIIAREGKAGLKGSRVGFFSDEDDEEQRDAMHELGIVSGILETVTAAAREAGASRVVAASLRIGDLREVVPESLDFAWEVLTEEDPITCGCKLEVEEIHPRSRCLACGEEFDHDRFHVRCPVCGGRDTHLLRGRELDLVSMEVES